MNKKPFCILVCVKENAENVQHMPSKDVVCLILMPALVCFIIIWQIRDVEDSPAVCCI